MFAPQVPGGMYILAILMRNFYFRFQKYKRDSIDGAALSAH